MLPSSVQICCFAVLAVAIGLARREWKEGIALAIAAWIAEDTCIRAYGFYEYHPAWVFPIDRVPLAIVLIWPVVILSSRAIARAVAGANAPAWKIAVATALLVAADAAFIEPIAVHAGLWSWSRPGLFGVPVIGILGW